MRHSVKFIGKTYINILYKMSECILQFLNYFAFFILCVVIGCKISTTCVYYTKLTILYLGFINFGNLLSIYGLFHKSFETNRFAKTLIDPIGKLLNIKYHVEGGELIDKNKAYIILANHQHALDVVSAMQVHNKIKFTFYIC